jgi:hypothetical protein
MAVAYVTGGRTAVGAGTKTLDIDCGAGTNKVLLVVSLGSNQQSTTVTFDGGAMTDSGLSFSGSYGGGMYFSKLWYVIAPASGTKTISVGGASSNGVFGFAYTGVDQTSPITQTATDASGSATSKTNTVASTPEQAWLFQFACTDGAGTNVASTGAVLRASSGNSASWCDSNTAYAAGSRSIATATTGGPCSWQTIYGALQEPVAPSSAIKTINGLAKASVKTVDGLSIASVKTWNGLA